MLRTVSKSYPRPAHNELLTLVLPTNQRVQVINDENGILDLDCVFINSASGKELYRRMFHMRGSYTLYAVASDRFPNKHYVVQWSHRLQRFGCSCAEGKLYGSCKHCAEVDAFTCREVTLA